MVSEQTEILRPFPQKNYVGGELPSHGRESEMSEPELRIRAKPLKNRETEMEPEIVPAPPKERPRSARIQTKRHIRQKRERRADFTFLSATSVPFATKLPSPTRNVDHYEPSRFKLHSSDNFLRLIPTRCRDGPPRNGPLGSFLFSHVISRLLKVAKATWPH